MSNGGLVAYDVLDKLLDNQKDDIHKHIRGWRNELIKLTNDLQGSLLMSDLIRINKMKSFLDAMDYALDMQGDDDV